jgi:hypothetical protein
MQSRKNYQESSSKGEVRPNFVEQMCGLVEEVVQTSLFLNGEGTLKCCFQIVLGQCSQDVFGVEWLSRADWTEPLQSLLEQCYQ